MANLKSTKIYSTCAKPSSAWTWVKAGMPRKDVPWFILHRKETWKTIRERVCDVVQCFKELCVSLVALSGIVFFAFFWTLALPFVWIGQWSKTSYDNLLMWQSARVANITGIKKQWVQKFDGMWED